MMVSAMTCAGWTSKQQAKAPAQPTIATLVSSPTFWCDYRKAMSRAQRVAHGIAHNVARAGSARTGPSHAEPPSQNACLTHHTRMPGRRPMLTPSDLRARVRGTLYFSQAMQAVQPEKKVQKMFHGVARLAQQHLQVT